MTITFDGTNGITFPDGKTQASGDFTDSLTANGYAKLPGGLIMQWGSSSVGPTNTLTVTMPITFPNGFLQAFGSSDANTGTASRIGAGIISTSQVSLINASGNTVTVRWLAIGF